jgi:hypothetical protein
MCICLSQRLCISADEDVVQGIFRLGIVKDHTARLGDLSFTILHVDVIQWYRGSVELADDKCKFGITSVGAGCLVARP